MPWKPLSGLFGSLPGFCHLSLVRQVPSFLALSILEKMFPETEAGRSPAESRAPSAEQDFPLQLPGDPMGLSGPPKSAGQLCHLLVGESHQNIFRMPQKYDFFVKIFESGSNSAP